MSDPTPSEIQCNNTAWEISKPDSLLEFYDDPDDRDSMIVTLEESGGKGLRRVNTVTQITLTTEELASLKGWLCGDKSRGWFE